MTPYDSDNASVSNQADTELGDAYEGADRLSKRYRFPLKVAVFYATVVAVGYVVHLTFESQLANTLAALMVYFTILFAIMTVLLGALFKTTKLLGEY
jgi:hypothetical protein